MSRLGIGTALLTVAMVAAGCSAFSDAAFKQPTKVVRAVMPAEKTVVVPGATASELAIGVSRAIFRAAPAVVLVAADDEGAMGQAADRAQALGVPLLVTPSNADPAPGLEQEIVRLGPKTVVPVGSAAMNWIRSATPPSSAAPVNASVNDNVVLSDTHPVDPLASLLVLVLDQPANRAAMATAKAAGARVLPLSNPDPRTDPKAIEALAHQPTEHVLAIGTALGSSEVVRGRVDTAATGVTLPGGGQVLFPYRRMVALYGHPGDTILGALGEQPVGAAVTRAKQVAAQYAGLVKVPVVPTFELIATVASSGAGADGDYSSESSIEHLKPWVDAAEQNGMYVVLDLQPGLTDFLTQAKRYEVLLQRPNVGLALDPEWRLKPGQKHMQQIGSVNASEINATSAWLAELTRQHHLPQKVLLLHQFTLNMIVNRSTLDTSHDELQNVWWGWKNFYDEDKPTFTPAETYAIKPAPVFVSYQ
jgi:hypothetical protein